VPNLDYHPLFRTGFGAARWVVDFKYIFTPCSIVFCGNPWSSKKAIAAVFDFGKQAPLASCNIKFSSERPDSCVSAHVKPSPNAGMQKPAIELLFSKRSYL